MNGARAALQVVHGTRGRLRLRSAEPLAQREDWERIEHVLGSCPLVRAVSVRRMTGSVVVRHTGASEDVLRWIGERGVVTSFGGGALGRAEAKDPLSPIADAIDAANERVRRVAGGQFDLRAVAFYGLLGAGALQLSRGQLWPKAETLIIHALGLLQQQRAQTR